MDCKINTIRASLVEMDIDFDFDCVVINAVFPVSTGSREQAIDEITEKAKAVGRQTCGLSEDDLDALCRQCCEQLDLSRIGL